MRKLLSFLFISVSFYSWSQSICGGSSATLSASNPSNLGSPQYSLNPGGFSPINGNQFVVSPATTTQYTLYTTGTWTNSSQITTSAVVIVTVFPMPVTNHTLIQPSCTSTVTGFNLGLTFNPASPAPSYTINWSSIPNGVLSGQQSSVASGVASGPYAYTITTNNGCVKLGNFSLNPVPAPAVFTLNPFGSTQTITCITPTIDISASNADNTYTWSSTATIPVVSQSINLNNTNLGTWTVVGTNTVSGCTKTYTFNLIQNIAQPSSTVIPLSQVINCSMTAPATVSVYSNPTVNIAHYITDPQGGIFIANSYTAVYSVNGPGTYTHCLVNLESGCQTCKQFSVTSTQGFPTFGLSSPDSFTLGCNTKSVATINIINAVTQPTVGGAVSYTIIGPPTNSTYPTGTLSALSQYTLNVPGTWTVVVKDNSNNCETKSLMSITQNTIPPQLGVEEYLPVLDCDHTVTVLRGTTESTGISAAWSFSGTPGIVPGFSTSVVYQPLNPTKTIINNYTLTLTDNSSTCRSTTVIPIQQNVFPPKVGFSLGTGSITCATPSIVLTNTSSTGIPPNTFPILLPVVGYLWEGPTPQIPLQLSTTYVGYIQGTYTLTGKDLNNGCFAKATMTVNDFRDYPTIQIKSPQPLALDCGAAFTTLSVSVTQNSTSTAYFWDAPPLSVVGTRTLSSFQVRATGIFTVTATNTVNFCVSQQTLSVVNATLNALFEVDKKSGFAPFSPVIINNSSSTVGNSSITSVWNFGNGTYTTTTATSIQPQSAITSTNTPPLLGNPTLTVPLQYTQPGTYTIVLHATKGACKSTTTQVITVEAISSVEVPNIFTPNADGINDQFFLKATNLSNIYFVVFDRWGHMVYELTSTTGNIMWDGNSQTGVEVADGIYFYVMKGTGSDGVEYDQKGNITIVR